MHAGTHGPVGHVTCVTRSWFVRRAGDAMHEGRRVRPCRRRDGVPRSRGDAWPVPVHPFAVAVSRLLVPLSTGFPTTSPAASRAPWAGLQDRAIPLAPTPAADLPPARRPDRATPLQVPRVIPPTLPRDPEPRIERRAA